MSASGDLFLCSLLRYQESGMPSFPQRSFLPSDYVQGLASPPYYHFPHFHWLRTVASDCYFQRCFISTSDLTYVCLRSSFAPDLPAITWENGIRVFEARTGLVAMAFCPISTIITKGFRET